MIFEAGRGYLMHAGFKDIAFEIVGVVAQGNRTAILHVLTWNRGWTGKPWITDHVRRIVIKAENYADWFYIDSLERYVP